MSVNASLGRLTIELVAQIAGFLAGMDKAQREAEARSKRIESAFRNAARGIQGAFAALGVYKFVKDVLDATVEQQNAVVALEATLRATGGAAGKTSQELIAMSKAIQNTTVYTDEAALAAEKLLLGYSNITGGMFDEAMKAVTNLASYMQVDLPAAARIVGMAFQNPIQAVSRLRYARISLANEDVRSIRNLQKQGDLIGAQKVLNEALTKTIEGQAEAMAGTLGGAMTQVKNAFGELYEAQLGSVGGTVKALKDLKAILQDPKFVESMGKITEAVIRAFGGAAAAVAKLVEYLVWIGEHTGDALSNVWVGVDSQTSVVESDLKAIHDAITKESAELAKLKEIKAHPTRSSASGLEEKIAIQTSLIAGYEADITRLVKTRPEYRRAEIAYLEKEIRDREQALRIPNPTYAPQQEELRLLKQKLELVRAIQMATEKVTLGPLAAPPEYLPDVTAWKKPPISGTGAYVRRVPEGPSGGGGTGASLELLTEYDKLMEKMTEELALIGKTTEAEKLHYRVTAGDLKLLEPLEKKNLEQAAERVRLKQLELVVATQLSRQYDSALSGYLREAETLRTEDLDELYSKVQQVALRESAGEFTGWDEEVINEQYLLAGLLDNLREVSRARKEYQSLEAAGAAITEANLTPQEALNEKLNEYSDLFQLNIISMDTFIRASAAAQAEMKKQADKYSAFIDQAKRNMEDMLSGAMTKWIDDFTKGSDTILSRLAKLLADMAAQMAAANLLEKLFKPAESASPTGFWGWLKSIFAKFGAGSSGAPPVPAGGIPVSGGFGPPEGYMQSGGPMRAGGVYRVGEGGPELVVAPAGGYVLPHGESLGGGGGVTVNIVNPPTQPQVTETRDANGQRQIQIIFEKLWQSSMADGKFDAGLRGRYGLRPAVGGAR